MEPKDVSLAGLRMFLWTDGSMTKALEHLTLAPVTVQIISENQVETAPCETLAGPYVRREVYLLAGEETVEHAVSYWNAGKYAEQMGTQNTVGIGRTLRGTKLETYRQILSVRKTCMSPEVAARFNSDPSTEFYQREYIIFNEGVPLTHLTETFSNAVLRYFPS